MKVLQSNSERRGTAVIGLVFLVLGLYLLVELIYGLITLEVFNGFGAIPFRGTVHFADEPLTFILTTALLAVYSAALFYGFVWAALRYKRLGQADRQDGNN